MGLWACGYKVSEVHVAEKEMHVHVGQPGVLLFLLYGSVKGLGGGEQLSCTGTQTGQ